MNLQGAKIIHQRFFLEINVARFAHKNETFLVGFKQCGSCFMLVNMDRLGNGKEEKKKSDEDYCHRGACEISCAGSFCIIIIWL